MVLVHRRYDHLSRNPERTDKKSPGTNEWFF